MNRRALYFIAGAPGSGKSTVVERFLECPSEHVVFDADAPLELASRCWQAGTPAPET